MPLLVDNPSGCITGQAVALLLLIGVGVLVWQAVRYYKTLRW